MKLQTARSRLSKAVATLVTSVLVLMALPISPAAAAATNVTAGATYSYTEQQGTIGVGSGITITNGTSYDGEYIDFAVSASDTHDVLSLSTVGTASTSAGVVSIVGNTVYLGNGSIAEPVGSVDPTFNGQNGQKLRVNFTTAFTNPGFEDGGTLGWTALQQQINLGSTNIAGFTANDTSTYPGTAPNQDNNTPSNATYTVGSVTSGQPTQGTYALQLQSNMTTAQGCDVVHGPAVYSSEFQAATGDKIYFDWRAFSGSDAYAVFGYIVDRNGTQTEVLDTYATSSSNTNWATKETVIPTGGYYRFVFVAGTFDATCGQAAGASLLIDNVKVFGSKASDDVAQQVARKLQYANTSDNPAAQRTISVTAKSTSNGTDTDTLTVNIAGIDDPFDATNPSDIVFTNTATPGESFASTGGQIAVSDPDSTVFNFALAGSTPTTETIGAHTYDQAIATEYGTMYVASGTGRYVFVPSSIAIDGRLTDDLDQFNVDVTSGAFSDQVTLTMRVDVPEGLTGSPTALSSSPGNQTVDLSWVAPEWIGGTGISGYRIYMTSNGGTSWAPLSPDASSGDTTRLVTGLNNGTQYGFRATALNASGESAPSATTYSTPRTVPGAPVINTVTEGDGELIVTFSAPSDDGGDAIDSYTISVNGDEDLVASRTSPGTFTIDGLTNGTAYSIVITANNAAGSGVASTPASGTPRTTPDSPTISGIVEHDRSVEIGITAPTFDGGSPITGYQISLDGGATFPYSFGPSTEWASITGLTNGTAYQAVVRALNEAGTGAQSAAAVTTPRTTPGAPTITSVTEDDSALNVTFSAPADDGGDSVSMYEYSIDGGITWQSFGEDPGTFRIGSLTNGTTYPISVRARNEAGPGSGSEPTSATPRTVAGTPSIASITESDRGLTVSFDPPVSDGGATITGYEISLDDGATWDPVSGPSPTLISGLTNGSVYKVRIRAINEAGSSVASPGIPASPRTLATAPTITRITSGNRTLEVHVTAPSSDGGAPITGYELSLDNGVTWTKSFVPAQSPLKVYGLENGTTYPVRVRAINEAGQGPASETVPGIPVKAPTLTPPNSGGGAGGPGGSGGSGGTRSGDQGANPKVAPGHSVVVINGNEVSVGTTSTPGSAALTVTGEGWTAAIGGVEEDGDKMTLDAQGRLIVNRDGSVRVTGTGFAPGTTVDVWLFSTPTFLGDVVVRPDGTFDQLLALPDGIEVGEHTVQMNGLGESGEVYSVSSGLIVKASPVAPAPKEKELAFTGGNALVLAPWSILAILGGIGLVAAHKRENDEDAFDSAAS